jgi:ABC-type thiamin/hydroxymethylpyrimidine transport system permease subunit
MLKQLSMKFPFFAITTLLSIFCTMMLLKSFDYGKAWATALAAVFLGTFVILTIVSIYYQIRKGEEASGHH